MDITESKRYFNVIPLVHYFYVKTNVLEDFKICISVPLNLKKHRAIQSQMHSVIINQDEITDQTDINKQIFSFYRSLFSRNAQDQAD